MKLSEVFPTNGPPPFSKGDEVAVQWDFHNGIGGKKAIVEACSPEAVMHSGWAVKINTYPKPIDAGWLIKIT